MNSARRRSSVRGRSDAHFPFPFARMFPDASRCSVADIVVERDRSGGHKIEPRRFTPPITFTGRSGSDHTFEFVVPPHVARPNDSIRAVNSSQLGSSQHRSRSAGLPRKRYARRVEILNKCRALKP